MRPRARADMVGGTGAVGLSEGVATDDQCGRFGVVHRHPGERLTDIGGRGDRVRVTVRALRIDIDQTHLDGTERLFEVAVTAVAVVAEPGELRTPVDVLFGLPLVDAAATEAEGCESLRFPRFSGDLSIWLR